MAESEPGRGWCRRRRARRPASTSACGTRSGCGGSRTDPGAFPVTPDSRPRAGCLRHGGVPRPPRPESASSAITRSALLCGARAPARGRRSEHPADGEAAEHRALFLSLELARAVVARQGELPAPAGDGQAVADFADDRLAVHAVAVAEGVAVEGDV